MKLLLQLTLSLVSICGYFSSPILDRVDTSVNVANITSVTAINDKSVNNESGTSVPRNSNLLPPYSILVTMTPSVSPTRSSSPSWSNENIHQSHEMLPGEKTYNNGRVNNANNNNHNNNNLPSLLPSLQQQAYELYLERLKRKKIRYPYGVMRWDNRPVTNYFALQSTPDSNLLLQQQQQQQQFHMNLPTVTSDTTSSVSSSFGINGELTPTTTSQVMTSVRATSVENVTRDPLEIEYESQLHSRFQQLCIQIRGYRCDTSYPLTNNLS